MRRSSCRAHRPIRVRSRARRRASVGLCAASAGGGCCRGGERPLWSECRAAPLVGLALRISCRIPRWRAPSPPADALSRGLVALRVPFWMLSGAHAPGYRAHPSAHPSPAGPVVAQPRRGRARGGRLRVGGAARAGWSSERAAGRGRAGERTDDGTAPDNRWHRPTSPHPCRGEPALLPSRARRGPAPAPAISVPPPPFLRRPRRCGGGHRAQPSQPSMHSLRRHRGAGGRRRPGAPSGRFRGVRGRRPWPPSCVTRR